MNPDRQTDGSPGQLTVNVRQFCKNVGVVEREIAPSDCCNVGLCHPCHQICVYFDCTDTECTGSFILSVLTNSRNIFQIVNIGNKSAAMAEADPGAAPPTEGGGAESGDGTIVRGQQFLVGPR